ncbi:MAG: alpha/beta hydrolase [Burkholderiales bacterium]|nr:alpha/beta hydrolase [Burkholderiales bacterium]
MIHGWPDTARLWDGQVQALAPHYRCVRLTLPGFGAGQPRRAVPLDELLAGFRRVIEQVSPGQPVVLMLHDWGCMFGYQLAMRHPELVRRIVGVDIGDAGTVEYLRALPFKAQLGLFAYQAWLALAWGIGRLGAVSLSDRMTRSMARALGCPTPPQGIHAGMNYPYYITWTGTHGSYRGVKPFEPLCPMLFLYGRDKPILFHTRGWAERVAGRPGSQVQAFDTGHWVMTQQPEQFNSAVLAWLKA